jgi:5-methylthioadenosine/S-adenosylhomocysteine deaminase
MLEAVKAAALLQKVARLDPTALTAGDVLVMATLEGARALALNRWIGSPERTSGPT